MKTITTLLLSFICLASLSSAYENKLEDERRLFANKARGRNRTSPARFAKKLGIYERCCSETADEPCRCPDYIRNFEGFFGWFNYKSKWEKACAGSLFQKSNIVALAQANSGNAVAQDAPNFSILVQALVDTGLDDILSGEGPFTVFAPPNSAFQPLIDNGTIGSLSTEQLTKVLKYHVIASAAVTSDMLVDGQKEETANGVEVVTFSVNGNNIGVKGDTNSAASTVVAADLKASNGIVHVIDQVLLPGNL